MAVEPSSLFSTPLQRTSSSEAKMKSKSQQERSRIVVCPRSPVISAPSILALQDTPEERAKNTKRRQSEVVVLSPSFSRAFSLFCSSPNLLSSLLPRLDQHDVAHFLNLTNSFNCSSLVLSSLRGGRLLKGGTYFFVSLYLQQLAHAYLHSCIGTFLCLTRSQLFHPQAKHKEVLAKTQVLIKTFVFLVDLLSSSLTELPETVLVLLFGWKSRRPMEMLIEAIIAPALENPDSLGFAAPPDMKTFTNSLGSLLRAVKRIGVIDSDALVTPGGGCKPPASPSVVEMLNGPMLQKKLKNLSNDMEQPKINQELPESYVSFLELWETNHHPCAGDETCEINLSAPLEVSLSVFQQILEDCHHVVAKRMKKRADQGKFSLADVDHAQKLMEALFLNC